MSAPVTFDDLAQQQVDSFMDNPYDVSPVYWAENNRTIKGRKLKFNNPQETNPFFIRPFLGEILDDTAPYKTIKKARQLGVSEICATEALWFCDVNDYSKVLYTFPTDWQLSDFSQTRVKPIIESSDYLHSRLARPDNVTLKKIGMSSLFFRPLSSPHLGEGIDIDVCFFDEIDRASPRNRVAFEESMSSSKWKWKRDISTPTIPGWGVDISFKKSSQNQWYTKCEACGEWQVLKFPESIVIVNDKDPMNIKYDFICTKCHTIGKINRRNGFWKPDYAGREIAGYQMSQLQAPWISATEIMKKKKDYPFIQLFYNYVLGMEYLGDNILMTPEIVDGARDINNRKYTDFDKKGRVVAGVDWGDTSWIVVGYFINDITYIIYAERIDDPDPKMHVKRCCDVMRLFNIEVMVCDSGYGKDRNSELMKIFPKRIYSCFYVVTAQNKVIVPTWNDAQSRVTVDRTVSLKDMFRQVFSKEMLFCDIGIQYQFVKAHLCSCVSVKDIDEHNQVTESIAHTGDDHYAHALNYLSMAVLKVKGIGQSMFFTMDSGMDFGLLGQYDASGISLAKDKYISNPPMSAKQAAEQEREMLKAGKITMSQIAGNPEKIESSKFFMI